MGALSPSQLLDVWDRCQSSHPFQRAQALLEAAYPDVAAGELADLSIGERDRRLLLLREATFGADISALSTCATCAAPLDVAFRTSDITFAPSPNGVPHVVAANGYEVEFRLPTGRDLADTDSRAPATDLLRRCIAAAHHTGDVVDVEALPARVLDAVTTAMAEADPQSHIEVAVRCPVCGASGQTPFDIVTFFWAEIDAWARRTLREIHTLATAYGWREPDILALSARRRRLYLDLIG